MAKNSKKKLQFRPDPTGSGLLSKLYITQSQRQKLLRWGLYSALWVAVLVLQDVVLCRLTLFGGMVDLTASVILLVCVLEDADNGSVFALAASIFYFYSGSAPGPYCIFLLPAVGIAAALFRQSYLRRTFGSFWLCAGAAAAVYQLALYLVALFLGQTYVGRISVFAMNALLTTLAVPVVYPAFGAIRKIGGETWKE